MATLEEFLETTPAPRKQGQDISHTGPTLFVSDRVGHKADSDSYARSKNKVYKRKIESQRKAKS